MREQSGEEPPCETCAGNLWPENVEAVRLYDLLASQMRYSMDGTPLGIDYGAVGFVFDLYGVMERRRMFEKIVLMNHAVLEAAMGRQHGNRGDNRIRPTDRRQG